MERAGRTIRKLITSALLTVLVFWGGWMGAVLLWSTLDQARPAESIVVLGAAQTLPNGLEVILHEDHSTPIVAVNTWYHVGSGDEKPGRTGFAHVPVGVFDKQLEP